MLFLSLFRFLSHYNHRKGKNCPKNTSDISYEHSTLRRHMGAKHKVRAQLLSFLKCTLIMLKQGAYQKWCKDNNFLSMLAEDSAARKADLSRKYQQMLVNFKTQDPGEKIPEPAYSDELFKEAAIQWLIETDQVCKISRFQFLFLLLCFLIGSPSYPQPIQALEHPSYQNMIKIAARAVNGVRIPSRKVTRKYIISLFKKQMSALRARLNVSPYVV